MNFVVWGLCHGVLLAIHRVWRRRFPVPEGGSPMWSRSVAWLVTFVSVNLVWAFFCMDVNTAVFFFRRLLIG